MNMDDGQKDKAVVVQMGCVTTFKVDYEAGPGHNNRFFQFTGLTNQPGCPKGDTCEEAGCKEGQGCCLSPNWKGELAVKQVYKKPKLVNKKKCIKKNGNVWCGTAGYPDPPQPVPTTTTTTATTTTTTTKDPRTCGDVCGAVYKKCAFWGDPHYTKTFNAAPPHFDNRFDMHGTGIMILARSKCGAVEVQSMQCPWWNGHMSVAAGIAIRIGNDVATFIGSTVRNDGLQVQGGGPWTVVSPDSCANLWVKKTWSGAGNLAGGPGNNWYHMDIELKMNDPDMGIGNCNGHRRNYGAPQNSVLFTAAEMAPLCGRCRFACPGALLEQDPDAAAAQNPPTAEEVCAQANIELAEAEAACKELADQTKDGGEPFMQAACMIDYCGSNGQEDMKEIVAAEKHFEDDDAADDAAVSLLQTADPGDKDLCTDLIKHEDANMDSPEDFKNWCQNEQGFAEADCNRALEKLGEHPWTQEKIDSVCNDQALA